PFVGIDAPAAIGVAGDVVDAIAADDHAIARAEGVDRAEIAQHAPAEVVEVILLDAVAQRGVRLGAPDPAGGDGGVGEIADVVVEHRVVAALADPDADGAGEIAAASLDDAVLHGVVVRLLRLLRGDGSLADLHAACAEIVQVRVDDRAGAATAAKP